MDISQFVPKFYQMDPETEDLLFDGMALKNGMVVLVADELIRQNVNKGQLNDHELAKALTFNRWAEVSRLSRETGFTIFMATYEDGTKRKVQTSLSTPWLVKIETPAKYMWKGDPKKD